MSTQRPSRQVLSPDPPSLACSKRRYRRRASLLILLIVLFCVHTLVFVFDPLNRLSPLTMIIRGGRTGSRSAQLQYNPTTGSVTIDFVSPKRRFEDSFGYIVYVPRSRSHLGWWATTSGVFSVVVNRCAGGKQQFLDDPEDGEVLQSMAISIDEFARSDPSASTLRTTHFLQELARRGVSRMEWRWPVGYLHNAISLLLALGIVWAFVGTVRTGPIMLLQMRRYRTGLCPVCAYERGVAVRCPECGEQFGSAADEA